MPWLENPTRGRYHHVMSSKQKDAQDRQQRLADQLRANLQKRKVQARARRSGDADKRDEGIAAAENTDPGKRREEG